MYELLRWLDVIPGRNWLVLGSAAAELAGLVREGSQPAGVSVAQDTPSFGNSTFDVVIVTTGPVTEAAVAELRRVVWPGGTVAAYVSGEASALWRLFQAAGLHAVQSCTIGEMAATRGTR